MSDLSEEDDSMEEDDSGEESDSSGEEESGEGESGSDSEIVDEDTYSEMNDLTVKNVQQQELSSSSDEGNERDRCPVCLNRFIGQDLGIPDSCEHIFCFDCIKEWATNINTCPIDRNEFNYVHLKRSPDGKVLKKVRVHVHSKEPEEGTLAEESTLCEVCRLGDREHRLLLCDACDLAYHCDCLDPPLFHIPIEEWFCPPCSSVMTQMGDGALPSTSRSRRVIPRTSASESVRVRVQNRRTYPSTNSRSTSTQRPQKRKRRTYRRSRCIKKVVKLARTKAVGGSGKGGKTDRATAVMVTYRKKYRRRKRRKTKTKSTRLPTKSAESNLQSAKERIAKRLGLCKARTGTAIPDVRTKPGSSSQSSSSDRTHSLFGSRDQLMDFNENFNEDMAVPSTSTSTPRNLPRRSETSAAPSNLLDSILAGQELLHTKSDNVIIRNDGSLFRKEGEKKKTTREASGTSKSVVRVGLYKPDAASKQATPERTKGSSSSLLHGALTKKKSSESHSSPRQKPGTSSSNSVKDIPEKTRKIKKEKEITIEGSSSSTKKSSDSYTHHREKRISNSSISTIIASKNPIKIEKSLGKQGSAKASTSMLHDSPSTSSCDTPFVPINSNLSDNKKQSEESQQVTSFNNQNNAPNHRMDILQKRASFLEKFNIKCSVSASKEHSGQLNSPSDESNTLASMDCNVQKLDHQSQGIKGTSLQINEIKIKDEPLSSDDEEAHSESLISQAIDDKIFPKTLKTESQDSESLIGNSVTVQFFSTSLNSSTTMVSSKLEVIPISIKKEPVSSDEESISPMSDNCGRFGSKVRIKKEPDDSVRDKPNNLPRMQAVDCYDDLPCTQAVERFEDFPCTQAVERFEDLPCTQAVEHFEDFSCTQAEHFEKLPCTQAVKRFEDLPCTQAVERFDDLSCTQAVDRFGDLPCTQAVEYQDNLPCTQAVECFEDLPCTQAVEPCEDLPCTQAVERFDNLPCTQAVERFDDLPCTQAVEHFNDLQCTQAVEPCEDLPCTQAVERFDDLPCTQAVERYDDLPCTQAVERFDDLPCTQAVERFDDLPCTQAVERFNDLPCMQAERYDDLPCTQAVERFNDLPCMQAEECYDDLPCTQAVERFEDLPCTQAVDRFDDLPCTQAVERFEDIPCTQAVENIEDLPCTQAVEHSKDLPCTQAEEPFEDLPCTQAVEPFEDLPCTQVADKLPNETVFKVPKPKLPITGPSVLTSEVSTSSKLSSKHSEIKKSKAFVDNSVLPATQPSPQKVSNTSSEDISVSRIDGTKHLVSGFKQEDKKYDNLRNALLLDDKELLEAKQALALLRSGCNKRKTPPKVVGVHRNLPQVITSAPVRRPLVPKPINKQTFSFEQVKQHFNLNESQKDNLSDTETNSKVSTNFKSIANTVSHLSSDSDSEHLPKLRQIIPNATTLRIPASSYETNSKNIAVNCIDKKNTNSLLGSDSKLMKPCLNKETLQDASNLEVNVVNKSPQSLYRSMEQLQPPSRHIKKEPLDIHEDTTTQKSCAVKIVDGHVGESNLERALRIKREMNAEVLQRNAYKDRIDTIKAHKVRNITEGSNTLRALSIKQEKNLEVMRENMLQASLENSRHVNGTPLVANDTQMKPRIKAEKETASVHIKIEKDNELNMNQYLKKSRGINKESEFKLNAKCIKKEPRERQEKCTKTKSDSLDKTLEKNKKSELDLEGKDKPINKESNLKKISKPIENNKCKEDIRSEKCKERIPPSKNKNICDKKNRDNKYAEKERFHKESDLERRSKPQEKDRHESKERNSDGNKRKADKDHVSSKERSNNSVKEQAKTIKDSNEKNNHDNADKHVSMVSIYDSRYGEDEPKKHFGAERNSHSKNKYTEKDKHYVNEKSAATKNIPAENGKKSNKESNFDRKNKHLESYEPNTKERSHDNKIKYDVKDKHRSEDRNSNNKDKRVEKDKHAEHKRGEKDKLVEKDKHSEKDKRGEKDKHGEKDKYDEKDKRREKDKRGEKDEHCRVNHYDRKNRHSENSKHDHKEIVADLKIKQSEKDQYDAKQSKCDRNNKPFPKNNKDRYSDSKTQNTETDKHYKRSRSERDNTDTDKDKFSKRTNSSFASRHDEEKTRENRTPKGNSNSVKTGPLENNKHYHNENNQTINKKELPAKEDKLENAFNELFNESKIKKDGSSTIGRKRSFEGSCIDSHSNKPNQENKKRKISQEADKQNLNSSSKSYISPDSTSGPDTAEKLTDIGSIKQDESLLDARIRKMMSHVDFDTRSSKKPRLESLCSEDTSGCFSDISQLSNEMLTKAVVLPFTSPEDQKHLVSSLKNSSEPKSSKDLKEEIASEIKLILKPFFSVGVVNKEDYKDIMRRAVPKVFVNCGNSVNPDKIKKLVLGYVAKLKNS